MIHSDDLIIEVKACIEPATLMGNIGTSSGENAFHWSNEQHFSCIINPTFDLFGGEFYALCQVTLLYRQTWWRSRFISTMQLLIENIYAS